MKAAWQQDNSMLNVFKKLYSNYEQIHQKEYDMCQRVVEFKGDILHKKWTARQMRRNVIAVMTCVPNRTLQFCFVDIRLTEISFNSIFLDRCQEGFPDAYKWAQKKIASIPFDDGDKEAQNAILAGEEMSSDD